MTVRILSDYSQVSANEAIPLMMDRSIINAMEYKLEEDTPSLHYSW